MLERSSTSVNSRSIAHHVPMTDYPYISSSSALKEFLDQIPKTGTPDKLARGELEARGFKSKNQRPIIPIMKFIGFVDDGGSPTPIYTNFKDPMQAGAIMASALRTAYADLFAMHPSAQSVDESALRSFFSTRTKGGSEVVDDLIATFKTLCEFADFTSEAPSTANAQAGTSGAKNDSRNGKKLVHEVIVPSGNQTVLNINIQVQLPTTEDATVYDRIFESLKKHLLKPD